MLAFEKIQMLQHAKAWKLKIFYHKTKQPFKVKLCINNYLLAALILHRQNKLFSIKFYIYLKKH